MESSSGASAREPEDGNPKGRSRLRKRSGKKSVSSASKPIRSSGGSLSDASSDGERIVGDDEEFQEGSARSGSGSESEVDSAQGTTSEEDSDVPELQSDSDDAAGKHKKGSVQMPREGKRPRSSGAAATRKAKRARGNTHKHPHAPGCGYDLPSSAPGDEDGFTPIPSAILARRRFTKA